MLYYCFKEFITNVLEGTVYPGSRQVNSLLNPQPSTTAIGRKFSTTKSTIAVFISLLRAKETPHSKNWCANLTQLCVLNACPYI